MRNVLALINVLFVYAVAVGRDALANPTERANNPYRVCYYVRDPVLTPNLLNASYCSHIIFGFGLVQNVTLMPAQPGDVKIYPQLMKLKTVSPDLKIMISVGGGGGAGGLPGAASSKENRTAFVKQALGFLETYGFDGLDFDWEFPGYSGDDPKNVQNFVELLKEFRNQINYRGKKQLLTAAVSASLVIIEVSYRVAEMAKYIDFINLMGYDINMYQKYWPFTGYNSALFKHRNEVIFLDTLNLNWTAHFWEQKGMRKSQIVVGIPTYGHTYTLLSPDRNTFRAPATGPGSGAGWITYTQVCDMLKSGGTRVFDNESMVPYAYKDGDWASYDDIESFTAKAKWIIQEGYAGVMTWNLNSDDWADACHSGTKFPLHQTLWKILTHR